MRASLPGFYLLLFLFSGFLEAQTITFVSDLNGRYGSNAYHRRVTNAVEVIVKIQPELVICTGDMVAGQKQPKLDADRLDQMWRGFNQTIWEPLSRAGIPFTVTPGNHDGSAFPEFVLERERYKAQWQSRMPELEILPGSEWPRRYAARMGSILLLTFDGTRPGRLPDTERHFVERMLQAYGTTASATIVFSHLPMWPLTTGREHEIIDDAGLLSLLHDNGVDVFASGHHHAFFAGVDDAGMVHLGLGALGGNARAFSGQQQRQPFSFASINITDNLIGITSRAAPDFLDEVPEDQMPLSITGPLGVLLRIDQPVKLRP